MNIQDKIYVFTDVENVLGALWSYDNGSTELPASHPQLRGLGPGSVSETRLAQGLARTEDSTTLAPGPARGRPSSATVAAPRSV